MKLLKKSLALLLAAIMVMAMSIGAFATDAEAPEASPTTTQNTTAKKTDNVTLTIKDPVEGHTYKVYQILKGDLANLDEGTGTLSNVEVGSSVKAEYTDASAIMTALKGLSEGSLGNAAYAYIDTAKAVATLGYKSETETKVTSTTVAPGYYVIVDESYTGDAETDIVYSRYLVAVVGNTEVTPKTSTPTIDKKIVDPEGDPNKALDDSQKTDTAAIGDIIDFEITGSVPNYEGYTYYYYVLNDTLSEGLTLVDKDNTGFTVKVGDTTLTRDTDYYVYKDGQSFKVAFKNIKGYAVGAAISVKYSAQINEKAQIGTKENTNVANLTYSNKPGSSEKKDKEGEPGIPDSSVPTGETPNKTTKTYVTQLNLTKVDQDGMSLQGATFTLTGKNVNKVIINTEVVFEESEDGTYYKLKTGAYTTTAPRAEVKDDQGNVTTESNADLYESTTQKYTRTVKTTTTQTGTTEGGTTTVTATVDASGVITFTGLNAGEYTLTETATPDGYNTISPKTFIISASTSDSTEESGGAISWAVNSSEVTESDGTFYVTVENKKGDTLPSTGGIGTTIFYVAGTILVLGAAVVLITKKRMNRA